MIIPDGDGKSYRTRRDDAIDAITEAIGLRLDPGEVRLQ